MTKYIANEANLKMMMNLLRDKSKNIQFEAFHVFKVGFPLLGALHHTHFPRFQVFVANPKKPPQIEVILRRNKEKLLNFLKTFHNDKEGTHTLLVWKIFHLTLSLISLFMNSNSYLFPQMNNSVTRSNSWSCRFKICNVRWLSRSYWSLDLHPSRFPIYPPLFCFPHNFSFLHFLFGCQILFISFSIAPIPSFFLCYLISLSCIIQMHYFFFFLFVKDELYTRHIF